MCSVKQYLLYLSFTSIHINQKHSFLSKKFTCYSRVLIITELVVGGTQSKRQFSLGLNVLYEVLVCLCRNFRTTTLNISKSQLAGMLFQTEEHARGMLLHRQIPLYLADDKFCYN